MRTFAQKEIQSQKRVAPAAQAIQRKLAISKPGDENEREADRLVERVMRMPEPRHERVCACGGGCPKCQTEKHAQKHERLQIDHVGSGDMGPIPVPPLVEEALSTPGQPLDTGARDLMESRFAHDFSTVRVHADQLAAQSAEAVAAQAYTVGSDVVFGMGRYAPASSDGQRLLAHELAHVLQQTAGTTGPVLARKPVPPAPAKSKTVFHPGVMHNHKPSGKWADVQANPNSSNWKASQVCKHFDPIDVMNLAAFVELQGKPIAIDHLNWFFSGGGVDFVEDANLDSMLRTDSGVQALINARIPTGRSHGTLAGHFKITQDDYNIDDFQFAFGAIDRLDFKVDFAAGTLHAWFQDRYEWHPVYPFYTKLAGDSARETNCVHAAAVELKSGTARDYWMKGETTLPLEALGSAAPKGDLQAPLQIY
jgi:hypothetical protein